jgi:hypothetical protein
VWNRLYAVKILSVNHIRSIIHTRMHILKANHGCWHSHAVMRFCTRCNVRTKDDIQPVVDIKIYAISSVANWQMTPFQNRCSHAHQLRNYQSCCKLHTFINNKTPAIKQTFSYFYMLIIFLCARNERDELIREKLNVTIHFHSKPIIC